MTGMKTPMVVGSPGMAAVAPMTPAMRVMIAMGAQRMDWMTMFLGSRVA